MEDSYVCTPLPYASENEQYRLNSEMKANNGSTPLHYISKNGKIEVEIQFITQYFKVGHIENASSENGARKYH